MKLLWHLNSHRQLEEYFLSSQFFNRTEFLKNNTDVLVTFNSDNINIEDLKKKCVYDTKVEIVKTTNPPDGVHRGQLIAINETFDKFADYDYVIHTTPDVYIVEEKYIKILLEEEINSDNHFIVDKQYDQQYCTDFFVFKPSKVIDFFNLAISPTYDSQIIEQRLFKSINSLKIPHRIINRGISSLDWQVDNYGLIHNHNLNVIKNILNFNIYPNKAIAHSHNLH